MKPLFYHDDGQTVCFGSEVQALTAWLTLRPDPYSIAAWLQRASPPSQGFTMYSGIQILPPGMILQLDRSGSPKTLGQVDLFQFLDIDYAREIQGKSTRELVDLVDEKLSASVEMQLAADVPVGAFCSGGVDSSVVMAMAAKRHKDLAIFHANVVGRHSEYDAARQLAEHLKLDLLFVDVHDQDFLEHLPIVTQHFGHPIAFRQDSLPLYLVSRLVQSHGIRAVISGEGADEIFLGYKALMPSRTNVLAKLKPLPIMFSNLVKRIVQGRYAQFNKIVNKPNLALGLLSRFETEIEQTSRLDRGSEKATLSLKMLHYHLRTLLHRNDAIGMSASIECRFPMLDRELVRLAVNLPYPTKIRNSFRIRDWRHPFIQNKWILRKVASRYVPKSLSLRPKRPFPTNAFERMQISAAFLKQSSAAQLLQLGTREIDFLVERGAKELLVLLLHLSVWCDVCLNDEAPSEVTKRLCSQITITPDRYQA
jgi:asparagine synthase (glutamine-hydrolysing)